MEAVVQLTGDGGGRSILTETTAKLRQEGGGEHPPHGVIAWWISTANRSGQCQ
jgi:hypothetical protein